MKRKFLLPAFILLASAMTVFFACSKSDSNGNDSKLNGSESVNVKFKSNQWPTFSFTKSQLSSYFEANSGATELTVVINSNNWNNPKAGMSLTIFGGKKIETLKQDEQTTTIDASQLAFGNNIIPISRIANACRKDGNWIPNFEYLRIIPVESESFKGYVAFRFVACDTNGQVILSGNMSVDSGDGGSNPAPPFGETCAEGYHICCTGCGANHPGSGHPCN